MGGDAVRAERAVSGRRPAGPTAGPAQPAVRDGTSRRTSVDFTAHTTSLPGARSSSSTARPLVEAALERLSLTVADMRDTVTRTRM